MKINGKTTDLTTWMKDRKSMRKRKDPQILDLSNPPMANAGTDLLEAPAAMQESPEYENQYVGLYAKGKFSKTINLSANEWNMLEELCQRMHVKNYHEGLARIIRQKHNTLNR